MKTNVEAFGNGLIPAPYEGEYGQIGFATSKRTIKVDWSLPHKICVVNTVKEARGLDFRSWIWNASLACHHCYHDCKESQISRVRSVCCYCKLAFCKIRKRGFNELELELYKLQKFIMFVIFNHGGLFHDVIHSYVCYVTGEVVLLARKLRPTSRLVCRGWFPHIKHVVRCGRWSDFAEIGGGMLRKWGYGAFAPNKSNRDIFCES